MSLLTDESHLLPATTRRVDLTANSAQKIPNSEYMNLDISDEEYREIIQDQQVYRINNPRILITRKGGSTHRVVDADGVAHCYAAPETGKSIIRWKAKAGLPAVKF